MKSITSGSSGDQSDDDEAEEDAETTENMDPTDAKRMRRYQQLNFYLSILLDEYNMKELLKQFVCKNLYGYHTDQRNSIFETTDYINRFLIL